MSKLSKFLKSPRHFFEDSRKKAAVKTVDAMSDDDINRFGLNKRPLSQVRDPVGGSVVQKVRNEVARERTRSVQKTRNDDLVLAQRL